MGKPLTLDDINEIHLLASHSAAGETVWGHVDEALDPVEWFAEVMGKRAEEGRKMFTVSRDSDTIPGETYLLVAITGNGPQSDANAKFFSIARRSVIALVRDLIHARHKIEQLQPVLDASRRLRAAGKAVSDMPLNADGDTMFRVSEELSLAEKDWRKATESCDP